ncbi:MAG: GGDEF domain-containing protein, partial [Gammaproteobacteria bacterium]|nr:GGDEF domain-containing protein [Gammaproteobacteria bacterium]
RAAELREATDIVQSRIDSKGRKIEVKRTAKTERGLTTIKYKAYRIDEKGRRVLALSGYNTTYGEIKDKLDSESREYFDEGGKGDDTKIIILEERTDNTGTVAITAFDVSNNNKIELTATKLVVLEGAPKAPRGLVEATGAELKPSVTPKAKTAEDILRESIIKRYINKGMDQGEAENKYRDFVKKLDEKEYQSLIEEQDDALRDDLTRIYSNKYLSKAGISRKQTSQIAVDLDNFKKVNDKYSHPVGDDVLVTTALYLQDAVGDKGVVARVGGEELAIFPVDKSYKNDILNAVEKARKRLEAESFAEGKLTGVSFSAGYGENYKEADAQLYIAKQEKAHTRIGGERYELQAALPAKPDTEGEQGIRQEGAGEGPAAVGAIQEKGAISEPAQPAMPEAAGEAVQADQDLVARAEKKSGKPVVLKGISGKNRPLLRALESAGRPGWRIVLAEADAGINGQVDIPNSRILVNSKSNQPVFFVAIHEVFESLSEDVLRPALDVMAEELEENALATHAERIGHELKTDQDRLYVLRDLGADVASQRATDKAFWQKVVEASPKLVRALVERIGKIVRRFNFNPAYNTSDYFINLKRVHKVIDGVLINEYKQARKTRQQAQAAELKGSVERAQGEYQDYFANSTGGKVMNAGGMDIKPEYAKREEVINAYNSVPQKYRNRVMRMPGDLGWRKEGYDVDEMRDFLEIETDSQMLGDIIDMDWEAPSKKPGDYKGEVPFQKQRQALTEEAKTENFKKWFGDSKVVDKQGKPLIVYHGTPDARFVRGTGIFKQQPGKADV